MDVLSLDAQILLNHTPTNRMVKVLVLGKSVQRELSIHLVQGTVTRSHKFHSTNSTNEISSSSISGCVLSLQSDGVV